MAEITVAQIRAARGLLGWSQSELGDAAKVGLAAVADFEIGKSEPSAQTLADLRAAIEAAGVAFISESGVGVGVKLQAHGAESLAPEELNSSNDE